MPNPGELTAFNRLPKGPIDQVDALVVLHPADEVAIARRALLPGTRSDGRKERTW